MAWNESGEDPKPRRRSGGPAQGAPVWRRVKQQWSQGRGARGPLYGAVASALLLLWLLSGCYQVDEGQRGVVERFGAYAGERGPGVGWHLPWPVESLIHVDLARLNSVDFQARMLSSDTALLNITGSVQFQLRDARQALYGLRNLDHAVRDSGEAATRQMVASHTLVETLGGRTRAALIASLLGTVQQQLDQLGAGVRVQAVNLTDVQVPEPVLAAQRDTEQALQDRERLAREAQGYAFDLLPRAQDVAQRQRLDAEAYKLTTIATAEGEAARFEPLLAAYQRAPEVTRNRLYVETIEAILARSHKVIIDGKGSGNTINIPLDKLLDAATNRGTGVTGVIEGSALSPAPASAGTAPSQAAAATAPATAPAMAPLPAASAAAKGAAGANSSDAAHAERDARSRERAEH
jgi:membrane protease subunit HflK